MILNGAVSGTLTNHLTCDQTMWVSGESMFKAGEMVSVHMLGQEINMCLRKSKGVVKLQKGERGYQCGRHIERGHIGPWATS